MQFNWCELAVYNIWKLKMTVKMLVKRKIQSNYESSFNLLYFSLWICNGDSKTKFEKNHYH